MTLFRQFFFEKPFLSPFFREFPFQASSVPSSIFLCMRRLRSSCPLLPCPLRHGEAAHSDEFTSSHPASLPITLAASAPFLKNPLFRAGCGLFPASSTVPSSKIWKFVNPFLFPSNGGVPFPIDARGHRAGGVPPLLAFRLVNHIPTQPFLPQSLM